MSDDTPRPENDPSEVARLRADRDQARQELGDTVAELADKVDVRARAEDKVHDTAEAAREHASEAAQQAREVAENVRVSAGQVADRAVAATPEPVREKSSQAVAAARRNPVPVAVALVSGAALIWWTRRRRRA
ncbi:DUF3618 domain-containing protein [Nocardia sp. NPDC057668]|uniref:DUF3618 domain-containing protein n=1 Tax=Nocardia sp. NPDC057668 TaxID=3346202 RepID=UPI00366B6819